MVQQTKVELVSAFYSLLGLACGRDMWSSLFMYVGMALMRDLNEIFRAIFSNPLLKVSRDGCVIIMTGTWAV